MSFLEPEDPIEPNCTECGEEVDVVHVKNAEWRCLFCGENFSDGTDDDEANFHEFLE